MKTIYVLQVHSYTSSLPVQFLKILYDVLAVPQHGNNLIVAWMYKASETKTKKKFDSNEFLIYYHSDIPLPSIDTKLVSVFNNKDDPKKYQQYNKDDYYNVIGQTKIKALSIGECRYLISLLKKIPAILTVNQQTTGNSCRYRDGY